MNNENAHKSAGINPRVLGLGSSAGNDKKDRKDGSKKDDAKDDRKCFNGGKTGHVKANCPSRASADDASRGRASEKSDSKTRSATPARAGEVRRSGRERSAPERYGFTSTKDAKKWLAAAVKKMSADELASLQDLDRGQSDEESHAGSETDGEWSQDSD